MDEKYSERLNKELELICKLDTTGVEPMFQVFENACVLRDDEVCEGYSISLSNVPASKDGMIEVPKTV